MSPLARAALEAQVVAITQELLDELSSGSQAKMSATLDADLALGSIERVELLSRLDRAFTTQIPESVIAEAQTLRDVVNALAAQLFAETDDSGIPLTQAAPPSIQTPPLADLQSRGVPGEKRHARLNLLATIYGFYAAGVFMIWLILSWLVLLTMPRGRAAARMTTYALRIYFRMIGCPIRIVGGENIAAHQPCIYVSNHTSYADVLAVMAVFDTDYHFVAKSEINQMPFIGTFLRKIGHFSFEGGKLRARSQQVEQIEEALQRGESVFIFAEGTFTPQRGIRPFQLGAFRAAVKTGKPIVPVSLRGTRELLRDGTILPKPSAVQITISPAIFPSGVAVQEWTEVLRLRDETRKLISLHSGEPLLENTP